MNGPNVSVGHIWEEATETNLGSVDIVELRGVVYACRDTIANEVGGSRRVW